MAEDKVTKLRNLLLEVGWSYLKKYGVWLLLIVLALGTAAWFAISSYSYRARLQKALIELRVTRTEKDALVLELKKARNDVEIEKEKQKDEQSAERIDALKKKGKSLEKERQKLETKRVEEKKKLRGKSIEELDAILCGKNCKKPEPVSEPPPEPAIPD